MKTAQASTYGRFDGDGPEGWLIADQDEVFCKNLPWLSAFFVASPHSPHLKQDDGQIRCAEVWGPSQLFPRNLVLYCDDPPMLSPASSDAPPLGKGVWWKPIGAGSVWSILFLLSAVATSMFYLGGE